MLKSTSIKEIEDAIAKAISETAQCKAFVKVGSITFGDDKFIDQNDDKFDHQITLSIRTFPINVPKTEKQPS
jgi:hypothetical protein